MSTITFDKLAYIDRLKDAGIDEKQARAQADALDAALKDSVATKYDIEALRNDIDGLETRLTARIDILVSRMDMLQWMVGGVGFGVLLLVIRTFWAS